MHRVARQQRVHGGDAVDAHAVRERHEEAAEEAELGVLDQAVLLAQHPQTISEHLGKQPRL